MGTDDRDDLFEMSGTVVEWDGVHGCVLTDCGERVPLVRFQLKSLGFAAPIKVGDRIHFYASEQVKVSYHIEHIRLIDPRESDAQYLRALKGRRRVHERAAGDLPIETFTGVIEWYDADKGYGVIRSSEGEPVLLHATCLRACGYRDTPCTGAAVEFEAMQRTKGWQAFRLLSLEDHTPS